MTTSSIHQRVLEQIRQRKLKPLPHWFFALRNDAFWALWVFSIALGGMALALLMLLMSEEEMDVLPLIVQSGSFWIFIVLPFAWVIIATLMILLAEYNLRHTEHGYRITPFMAGLAGISISILLGIVLHTAGWGNSFDTLIRRNVPSYENVRLQRMERWMHTETGMLGGTIEEVRGNTILLRDYDGFSWIVVIDSFTDFKPAVLQWGMPIRILGDWEAKGLFHAREIRKW